MNRRSERTDGELLALMGTAPALLLRTHRPDATNAEKLDIMREVLATMLAAHMTCAHRFGGQTPRCELQLLTDRAQVIHEAQIGVGETLQ